MLTYTREYITPDVAASYLKASRNPRGIGAWYVALYERLMRTGLWHETHQGVAFGADGSLVDGGHRLTAIVRSGVGVWIWVARGLSREAVLAVDGGKPRSLAEALHTYGVEVSKNDVATCRVIAYGERALASNTRRLGAEEFRSLIAEHEAALTFTREAFSGRRERGLSAAVRGIVGRASYTSDLGALREFVALLKSAGNSTNPARGLVMRLRDFLRDELAWRREGRIGQYRKTARALRAFLDKEPLDKLYADADPDSSFPIPD